MEFKADYGGKSNRKDEDDGDCDGEEKNEEKYRRHFNCQLRMKNYCWFKKENNFFVFFPGMVIAQELQRTIEISEIMQKLTLVGFLQQFRVRRSVAIS